MPSSKHFENENVALAMHTIGIDWWDEARCYGKGEEIWFEEALELIAKLVCKECPVKKTCLDWAMTAKEPYGIWGGLSVRERRALAKRNGHNQSSESA